MADSNFLPNFIRECVSNGKITPSDMCIEAEARIDKVNQEIKRIKTLSAEKSDLYSAIRQLGGNKEKDRQEYKSWDFSIPEDKLVEHHRNLVVAICNLIEDNPEGLLMTDIRDVLDSMKLASLDDDEPVFFSIKWLLGRLIIDKNSSMRIIKGEAWDKRPNDNDK